MGRWAVEDPRRRDGKDFLASGSPIYIRKAARDHLARCLEALPGIPLGDFLDDLILRHGGAAVLDYKKGSVWGVPVWPEELG